VYVVVAGGVVVVVDEGAVDHRVVGDVVRGAVLQPTPNKDTPATANARIHRGLDLGSPVVVRGTPIARPSFL
jgi:hypothetical protein